MSGLFSFLIGFFAIALMVTVHETGHFFAARMVGITVETFAIGWGRALKRWRSGGVEYRINLFPLGGYCKLKGSEDLRRSLDEGGIRFEEIEAGSLFYVPPVKRIITYLAGPLANLMFATLIFIPFFALDHEVAVFPNKIVLTSDYPAIFETDNSQPHAARDGGLQSGDVVIKVGDVPTVDFSGIQQQLARQETGVPTSFTVRRGTRELRFEVLGVERFDTGKPFFGISYYLEPIVGMVDQLSPEAVAGLVAGDRITAAQGIAVDTTWDLLEAVSENPQIVVLEVLDPSGDRRELRFSPHRDNEGSIKLSFAFSRKIEQREGLTLPESFTSAVIETVNTSIETLMILPRLLGGGFALNEVVAGPLRISYVIGETRNAGLRALLHLMAMVSVSLAAANLLPIPGLDGGAILLSLLEMIRGKTVSPRMYVRFQSLGFAFLMVLMVMVVAGDLRFIFSGS